MSVPSSPARSVLAAVSVLGSMCGLLMLWAAPATAVQTSTFSLTPTGERTSIVVYSRTGTRTDHFVLRNLKSRPITVALQVLSLTKSGNAFKVGSPNVGFSSNVSLSVSSVRLAGGQVKVLPVRVDTEYDGGGEHFAVIDAHQVPRLTPGMNVVPHLQLAIELKPAPPRGNAGGSSSTGADALLGIAAALIAIALAALALELRRRRMAGAG